MSDKAIKNHIRKFPTEQLIEIICYVSLPLILLFLLTIITSVIFAGNLNTDVNAATSFKDVFVSFTLPMLTALVIAPLTIKLFVQKTSLSDLGLAFPISKLSLVLCILMGAVSIILTFCLDRFSELKVSAWTVLFHFFFVALSEEIILRSIIMNELLCFSRSILVLCVINGAIFAFIYHSSEDFFINLLVRFPLGLILSFVRLRSKSTYPAVMLHLMYNMIVTII